MSLLFKLWNLNKPKLVISITGGARLNINPSLIKIFCQGLLHVSEKTSNRMCFQIFSLKNYTYSSK